MNALRPALGFALALVSLLALACGGGGAARPNVTPARQAPRNVIAFGGHNTDGYGLFLIKPDGSDLHRLSPASGAVSFPRWSPDGARIAFIAGGAPGGASALRIYDFVTAGVITVSDSALAGTLGAPDSWSPDGTLLAFVENAAGAGRLRVYDVTAAALRPPTTVAAAAVDWSPTSGRIAVILPGASTQSSELESVQPDGSSPRALQSGALEGDPRWSPDGTQIAFWSAPSALLITRALALSGSGGGQPKQFGVGLDPSWSPDGKLLAYSRPASATPGADFDIYTIAVKGGQPELLTHSITLDRWPSFSPAGDAVVFLAQADLQTAFLCVTTVATKKSDCLHPAGILPTQAAWSPF